MTIETLRRLSGWVEKIAAAAGQVSSELKDELTNAEARRDPLATHIFQARADFRRTSETDRTKHSRHVETALLLGFKRACELGFEGDAADWRCLMRSGRSMETPSPSAPPSNPPPHAD